MAQPVSEFFTGGVCTLKHPALLKPGELQRGTDCVYRDRDQGIWRAPGRTALNTALSAGAKGLMHLTWEGTRSDQILAYSGTALFRAPIAAITDTLAFVEISTAGRVAGTVTSTTTFTATTGQPFHTDIVGATVYFIASSNTPVPAQVTAVSGTPVSGHYPAITLSVAQTNGDYTLAFQYGIVASYANNGADANHCATDESLDGAFYGSSYFIWTGRGTPRRVLWSKRANTTGSSGLDDVLVARPAGMLPVPNVFTTTVNTGTDAAGEAYAWPTSLGTGVFWFLLTELYIGPVDPATGVAEEIEGAYLGKTTDAANAPAGEPVSATIGSLTSSVTITTNAAGAVNNGSDSVEGRLATHWAVYMYGPTTDASTKPSLASFRRVTTSPIQQTTTGYGVSQAILVSDSKKEQGWAYPSVAVGGTTEGKSAFTNEANMLGNPDGLYASAKSGSATDGSEQADAESTLKTFKVTSGSAVSVAAPWSTRPVSGVTVAIRGSAYSGGNAGRVAGYFFYLVNAAGTKRTERYYGDFGTNFTMNWHGGETNNLGVAWTAADFDTNFSIIIGKTGTGSRQRLRIESCGVKVTYSSGSINLNGKPYRVVTYRDQIGTTVNDPANIPLKECSTGDFFQGSLLLNDLSDETAVRWTLPGNPEAQPKPYVLRFNTKKRDKVNLIRTLGTVAVVGLRESIKRVNYLPRETDTDLQSGLAQEDIATDHGIPGPLCAARFDMPGVGTLLAYASQAGPYMTNGITTQPLNMDLDWENTVKMSALGSSVMVTYPKEKWIAFYYCPAGATHNLNTRVIYYCYQADKIKEGGYLPAVGPCVVSGKSAISITLAGVNYLLSGHESNGLVYREDSGNAIPSGYQVRLSDDTGIGDGVATASADVKIAPVIRTRKMFAGGLERDSRASRLLLLFTAAGSTSTVTATPVSGSTTVTCTGALAVHAGRMITGTGYDPGTYITAVSVGASYTISRAANADAATGTATLDTGTLVCTTRGSGVRGTTAGMSRSAQSTTVGDLLTLHNDDAWQGLELQIEKVPLTFSANADGVRFDSSTYADLGVAMRLHQFTWLMGDAGMEMNRTL